MARRLGFRVLVAGALANYAMTFLFAATNATQVIGGIIYVTGGAALWTFWAVWWATRGEQLMRK